MEKRKSLSMRKTMLLIMMTGYTALLILLLSISWYLIVSYQRENRAREMGVLTEYVNRTEKVMQNIDRHLYDVYAYNQNFDKLSGILSDVENYNNAYTLRESLKNKVLIDENIHGYFLYYDRLSLSWYSVNSDKIKPEKTSELNKKIKIHINDTQKMRNWSVLADQDDVFLLISSRKNNAAISAVHNLADVKRQLQSEMDKKIEMVFINDGIVLQGKEFASQLNLKLEINQALKSFSKKIGNYYVYAERIEKTGLWVFMVTDYNLWNIMNLQQVFLLCLTFGSALAVAVLYRYIKKQLVYPLRELTNIMNQIRVGELHDVPILEIRFKELKDVNETLGSMVKQLEEQKLLVYEEIIEKQKAQMQYLQLQIAPHFFLNALKTLNVLSENAESEKMQELILKLSLHMRYLMQGEREIVPLSEEIEFVKNFIQLQKEMSDRNISCEFDIDPSVENWKVPVLCIQTFVENSIKYVNTQSRFSPLLLKVQAVLLCAAQEHFIDLIISDNGQGYSPAVLQEINAECVKGNQNIGINNIKRRLRLLYGEKAEYSFTNQDGAISELIIPKEVRR